MAADRTLLAMTTGRLGASAGSLRPAIPAHAKECDASSGAALSRSGALALSLELPIGCRA
jgi:hypothetical protein